MKATLNIYTVKRERKSLSSVSIDKQFSTFPSSLSLLFLWWICDFFLSSTMIMCVVTLHIPKAIWYCVNQSNWTSNTQRMSPVVFLPFLFFSIERQIDRPYLYLPLLMSLLCFCSHKSTNSDTFFIHFTELYFLQHSNIFPVHSLTRLFTLTGSWTIYWIHTHHQRWKWKTSIRIILTDMQKFPRVDKGTKKWMKKGRNWIPFSQNSLQRDFSHLFSSFYQFCIDIRWVIFISILYVDIIHTQNKPQNGRKMLKSE